MSNWKKICVHKATFVRLNSNSDDKINLSENIQTLVVAIDLDIIVSKPTFVSSHYSHTELIQHMNHFGITCVDIEVSKFLVTAFNVNTVSKL